MSRSTQGYIVWGAWAAIFLVLEVIGEIRVLPWRTLSETSWGLESKSHWVSILLIAVLVVIAQLTVAKVKRTLEARR